MKKVLQFLFFAGFGVLILWLVYRSQNAAFMEQCRLDGKPEDQCNLMRTLIQDFRSASPWWLLLVMATFTVSNAFRAWRWQMLLEPLGYKTRFANGFWSIILGYFANLGLPRMGEVTRAGALARYERIPAERVMGTLVIDRLMDFICLGCGAGFCGRRRYALAVYQRAARSQSRRFFVGRVVDLDDHVGRYAADGRFGFCFSP